MNASVVDLRYRMKDVLGALRRNEEIHILYHGKPAGTIIPARVDTRKKVQEHPFFGMSSKAKTPLTVEQEMTRLRSSRYHAV